MKIQGQTCNLPHSQVHGSNGKQRERVDLYHDGHEGDVQQNFDETWKTDKVKYGFHFMLSYTDVQS